MPLPPDELQRLLAQRQLLGLTYVESTIAQDWLRAHAAEWDSVQLYHRLGPATDPGPGADEPTRRLAELVSRSRVDLLMEHPQRVALVEIKLRLDIRTGGQLMGYRELWRLDHPGDQRTLWLIGVGRSIAPGVELIYRAQAIQWEIIPGPLSPTL